MRTSIFLLFVISFINLNAQDIIIKTDGTEIESKVIEVGIENVKYSKFNNPDGPTYLLPKNEIFLIKYEDGSKEIYTPQESTPDKSESTSTDFRRKGMYLGFHLIPGTGGLNDEYSSSGFAFNSGVDFNILFNDWVGIKTGFSYQTLSYDYEYYFTDMIGNPYYTTGSEVVNSIGIPIKFLLITGKKTVGFFLESGFTIWFPTSSEINIDGWTFDGDLNSVVLAEETSIGINIKASELISLNLGMFVHYSLTNYFIDVESLGYMVGFQSSMLFKLR